MLNSLIEAKIRRYADGDEEAVTSYDEDRAFRDALMEMIGRSAGLNTADSVIFSDSLRNTSYVGNYFKTYLLPVYDYFKARQSPVAVTEAQKAEVVAIVLGGEIIPAIKKLRELTGCGLKDAKDTVERWRDEARSTPQPPAEVAEPQAPTPLLSELAQKTRRLQNGEETAQLLSEVWTYPVIRKAVTNDDVPRGYENDLNTVRYTLKEIIDGYYLSEGELDAFIGAFDNLHLADVQKGSRQRRIDALRAELAELERQQ